MKALILATAMAVGFASYASAAEVKKDAKKAPVVASKAMTDKDMDKVTAGAPTLIVNGVGNSGIVGNVVLGGQNLQGVPSAPPSTHAWSGSAPQAAKPCIGC